jgi:hypothetical protein
MIMAQKYPGENSCVTALFKIDASKEVGLEVNAERIKYMLLSHHQNAGQIHDLFKDR